MDDISIQEDKEEQKQTNLKKEVLVNKLKAEGGA